MLFNLIYNSFPTKPMDGTPKHIQIYNSSVKGIKKEIEIIMGLFIRHKRVDLNLDINKEQEL